MSETPTKSGDANFTKHFHAPGTHAVITYRHLLLQ